MLENLKKSCILQQDLQTGFCNYFKEFQLFSGDRISIGSPGFFFIFHTI